MRKSGAFTTCGFLDGPKSWFCKQFVEALGDRTVVMGPLHGKGENVLIRSVFQKVS